MSELLTFDFLLFFLNTYGYWLLGLAVVLELLVYVGIFFLVRHLRRKKIR